MKAEILQFVQEKTKELIQAPTCSAEARKAAEQWLALVGTEREAEETKAYLAELEEDIVSVISGSKLRIGMIRSSCMERGFTVCRRPHVFWMWATAAQPPA